MPWVKIKYPNGNYEWTQDGAPFYTATKIQDFCKSNFCIFWESFLWPLSSPDLNLLNYSIWCVLKHATNRTPHSNVDSLKETITQKWERLSPKYLKKASASFRRRVKKEGSHIE